MSLSFEDNNVHKSSKVCDKKLNDNKWHTISLVCKEKQPVQVTVDGEKFEVETGERKPSLIEDIYFGITNPGSGGTMF